MIKTIIVFDDDGIQLPNLDPDELADGEAEEVDDGLIPF